MSDKSSPLTPVQTEDPLQSVEDVGMDAAPSSPKQDLSQRRYSGDGHVDGEHDFHDRSMNDQDPLGREMRATRDNGFSDENHQDEGLSEDDMRNRGLPDRAVRARGGRDQGEREQGGRGQGFFQTTPRGSDGRFRPARDRVIQDTDSPEPVKARMAPVAMKVKKKPGPKPTAKPVIMKDDITAKKALIKEIEGHWGKDFIKTFIPKCHRPLTKRKPGKARTHNRKPEDNPVKWLPSVLKAILNLAKKTDDKVLLKKLMGDVVRFRNQHTGNKKPQLVTTDFDMIEDIMDHGWSVEQSFKIRYKHLITNRLDDNVPTNTKESDDYYKHLFCSSSEEDGSEGQEDQNQSEDGQDYELSNDYQLESGYYDEAPPPRSQHESRGKQQQFMHDWRAPHSKGYQPPMNGYGQSRNDRREPAESFGKSRNHRREPEGYGYPPEPPNGYGNPAKRQRHSGYGDDFRQHHVGYGDDFGQHHGGYSDDPRQRPTQGYGHAFTPSSSNYREDDYGRFQGMSLCLFTCKTCLTSI